MKAQEFFNAKSTRFIAGGAIFVGALTAANIKMLSTYAVDDVASFSYNVPAACILSDDTSVEFDASDRVYTATGTAPDITLLTATQYTDFECNSDTASVTISGFTLTYPGNGDTSNGTGSTETGTNTNATSLEATHSGFYGIDDTDTTLANPTVATSIDNSTGVTGFTQNVNNLGLFRVGITSSYSNANGMLEGTYDAQVTVTVAPN